MKWCLFILTLMLISCSEERSEAEEKPEFQEKASNETSTDINMIEGQAEISWERHKQLNHLDTRIKLKGTDVNLSLDDLSFITEGEFKVTSAKYYEQNGHYHAIIKVDLRPLKALQKDSSDRLSLVGPNYLDIANYPTASINLTNFNGDMGEEALAILHIKDEDIMAQADYEYTEDEKGFKQVTCRIVLDAVDAGLINPDLAQDIEKDDISIDIKLNR